MYRTGFFANGESDAAYDRASDFCDLLQEYLATNYPESLKINDPVLQTALAELMEAVQYKRDLERGIDLDTPESDVFHDDF